jgi:SAM-dependent methyltransferase
MSIDEARVQREKDFHNDRFGQEVDPRQYLDRWYASIRHCNYKLDNMVRTLSWHKSVLEYGCADGSVGMDELHLPDICQSLIGIDISEQAVAKATVDARKRFYNNAAYLTMNAEAMEFSNNSFDVVFGRGILHHLDLNRAFSEIARVLKPGGFALFTEPMGHNPFLNRYRNKTPDIRTSDEHPLLVSDFDIARTYFDDVNVSYYGMFSIASAVLGVAGWPYRLGRAIDNVVLKSERIGKYAWYSLIVMQK